MWQTTPAEATHHNCAHHKGGISFYLITQLSKLSWEVADGKTDFAGARQEMNNIVQHPQHTGRWTVLLLASLANASFCRLFQRDITSMLIVFIATVAGYLLKQIMLEYKHDVRLTFFCSTFFSSVIAAGGYVFGCVWVCVGGGGARHLPGYQRIVSNTRRALHQFSERHARRTLPCSFSRFMNTTILTFCLSVGLCSELLTGTLNIGVTFTFSPLLTETLLAFMKSYPK